MRMSAARGEAGVGSGISKNLGVAVGVDTGLDVFGSRAAVPGSLSTSTPASLTHRRTRIALMPFAMATEADETPGWEHAATMCSLNSAL